MSGEEDFCTMVLSVISNDSYMLSGAKSGGFFDIKNNAQIGYIENTMFNNCSFCKEIGFARFAKQDF